jgi:holo-[acyl-carrier protein] synthase
MSPVTDVTATVDLVRSIGDAAIRSLSTSTSTSTSGTGSPGDQASAPLRVGVDVAAVAEVADSVRIFGDRYLQRIFTSHELDCCRSSDPMADSSDVDGDGHSSSGAARFLPESLAARFAAKEAAIKVLRPIGPRPEWRAIEVRQDIDGGCSLRLSGLAARLAEQAGLDHLAVSLTHDAGIGAAVVVALHTGPDLPSDRTDHAPTGTNP